MHPTSSRLRLVVGLALVQAFAAQAAEPPGLAIRKEMARQFQITASPLEPTDLPRYLTIPGVIRPDETKLVRITTVAEARIRQIFVYPGDRVPRLAQLATVDSVDLARQKSSYLASAARRELASRMLEIEEQWAKLEVDARKPLEQARRESLGARNALKAAVAQAEVAERRYEAEKTLFEDGITSKQNLDQAKANFSKASAELERSRKDLTIAQQRLNRERLAYDRKILPKRELQQAEARLEQAEIELEGARTNLSIHGLKPTTSMVELEQEYITKNKVVTPMAGTVIRQNVKVGEVVRPDQHLFEVADLSTVWFEGKLFEKDRRLVKVGQSMKVRVTGQAGRDFGGKVMRVFPFVEAQTRTVPAIGYLYNPDRALVPGMFARARIEVEEPRPRLVLPRTAVQDFEGQDIVFVQLPGEQNGAFRYVMREVELGHEFDLEETEEREQLVEVTSGLTRGDPVVTRGAFSLVSEWIKRGGGAE
jgi:RND family efflux transporter MFP subunit